jgi:hypothetical protein
MREGERGPKIFVGKEKICQQIWDPILIQVEPFK